MATCPSDKMEHAPPTVLYDRPGAGFWQSLQQWQVEAKERIEAAGDFRGGGFRWDKHYKRLGVGWTPPCKIPDAKVHIQGDGFPTSRPLALRVDGKSGADSSNPLGEVFFGDISLSTYSSEGVHFEIATAARASRSRGFRYAGGAKTALSGGELIDFNVTPADMEYATGTTLALHRGAFFSGPTLSATSAKGITTAATLYVTVPVASTNVTIGSGTDYFTGPFAIVAGNSHFSGNDNTTGPSSLKKPPPILSFCRVALTALSSGYDYREFSANVGNSIQWTTAPPTTVKLVVLNDAATPLASTVAATINDAYSVYVTAAPSASTNVTITRPWALGVGGKARFLSDVTVDGNSTLSAMTAGRVVYTGTGGLLSSTSDLQWDATNKRLAIGVSGAPGWALHVIANASSDVSAMQNTSASGVSGIVYYDSAGTARAAAGYGNASFGAAARAGRAYFWISGKDLTFTDDTTHFLYIDQTNARVGVNAGTSLTHTLDVRNNISGGLVQRVQNSHTAGFSGIGFYDSSGNLAGSIGYANSTSGVASILGALFIYTQNKNLVVGDNTAKRLEITTAGNIGVFAATPVAKQTVTGSRGGNAALASLLTAMANFGWITDSSTA